MEFPGICYHLIDIYLHNNQHLSPPEFEALACTLDRLLPLLTPCELAVIPHASDWVLQHLPRGKGVAS